MVQVIPYGQSSSVFRALDDGTPKTIITSGAESAMAFWKTVRGLSTPFEVFGLGEWVRSLLERENIKLTKKSDLLIELWGAWGKAFAQKDGAQFLRDFQRAQEVRGYSHNSDLLMDVVSQEQEKGLAFLLSYLQNQENLWDENKAYKILKEIHTGQGPLVFWGHNHLSGNQIDLLLALAEKREVIIPLHREALEKSSPWDWPHWACDVAQKVSLNEKCEALEGPIAARNVDSYLLPVLLQQENRRIYFWSSSDQQRILTMLPRGKYLYHQKVPLFLEEKALLFECLKEGHPLPHQVLPHQQDRWAKLKEALSQALEQWDGPVGPEDLPVLREVVDLELPQVFRMPFETEGLQETSTIDHVGVAPRAPAVVILTLESISEKRPLLSEALMAHLAAIGPVRNSEFDQLIKASSLSDLLLQNDQVEIFMERGFNEAAPFFDDLYGQLHFTSYTFGETLPQETSLFERHFTGTKKKKASPSSLQAFIDCPLKYYYCYLDQPAEVPDPKFELSPREIGQLAHRILELVFHHPDRGIEEIISSYEIQAQKSYLYSYDQRSYRKQLSLMIEGAMEELKKIQSLGLAKFEQNVEDELMRGKLDFLFEFQDEFLILDFKKSKGSLPQKKEILSGDSIQVTSYMKMRRDREVKVFGYFCLDSPEESLIFYREDSGLAHELKKRSFLKKYYPLPQEKFEEIFSKIDTHLENLRRAQDFFPLPRAKAVCSFCPIEKICPKGGA